MLAVNEIERSSFTEPVVIKTREEAPTEAPQSIHVQSGGVGELIVTWQVYFASNSLVQQKKKFCLFFFSHRQENHGMVI